MARHALIKLSHEVLPLTAFQIHSMLAVAPVDQLGSIKYTQLVPLVTRTLQQVTDAAHMKERFRAIERLAHTGLLRSMASKDGAAFEALLRDAFAAADADESGTLTGVPDALSMDACAVKGPSADP